MSQTVQIQIHVYIELANLRGQTVGMHMDLKFFRPPQTKYVAFLKIMWSL